MVKKTGELTCPELDMINSAQKHPFKVYGTNTASSITPDGKMEDFVMKDIFWIWNHPEHGSRAGFSTSEEAIESIREVLRDRK